MASLLNNDGLSDGSSNKRPLENGYHSSILGNTSKYKPRKISAVRDFPPMCDRNAQLTKLEPKEDVIVPIGDHVAVTVESNGVKTETGIQNQPHDIPIGVETNGLGISSSSELQEKVVVPLCDTVAAFIETNDVETETRSETQSREVIKSHFEIATGESGKPNNLEARANVVEPIVDSAVAPLEVNGVKTETGVEIESHEVVESPVGVEGNDSLEKLVEKVVSAFTDDVDDWAKEMKDLEKTSANVELLKEVDGNGVEALVSEVVKGGEASEKSTDEGEVKPCTERGLLVLKEVPVKDDVISSLKNKFRRRRVSATRDFPPYCGRNAPVPSIQEQLRIKSGESSLGFEKVNVDNKGAREALKGGADSREWKEVLLAEEEMCSLGKLGTSLEVGASVESVLAGGQAIKKDIHDGGFPGSQERAMVSLPMNISEALISKHDEEGGGFVGKEIVLYASDQTGGSRALDNGFGSGHEIERVIVNALMAAPYCPWRQAKVTLSSGGGMTGGNVNTDKSTWRGKSKAVARKTIGRTDSAGRPSLKRKALSVHKGGDGLGRMVDKDEGKGSAQNEEPTEDPIRGPGFGVNLPPFGPSSSHGDARNRVRETLRLFQALCRKLLQGEESRPEEVTKSKLPEKSKRIDLLAAKIIKEKGKEVNTAKYYLGAVPGVEVGDEFQYRVELAIVGVHRLYQAGIDSIEHNGVKVAISIVASGAYDDDMENADVLIYSGQGGNVVGKNKQPADQKLEKGNLALKNSISERNPVRVIRGSKESKASDSQDSRAKLVKSYVYDGLYTVENFWPETGNHGKLVYMFKLQRIPGQPELAWKEVKSSKKSKVRHGVCIDDIAGGVESIPICVVNTIDNEKPQPFKYIRKMIYPDWFDLLPPKGCDCVGRCSDSRKCSCAQRNGEIPYNHNGAIVEAKHLVYECGPHCKCPSSCYNRVSQHGIKTQLEIFKTESRGWGVRSLTSISSGSFICEYAGELLEDKEAELRTGNDEYLFDIGQNYTVCSLNPDGQVNSSEAVEEGGFTIDAANCGNVGRFINHSCSPNLYAQNVLYDHDDKRMPHIMLFAAENIPPLQELTYHYNYIVGQVYDSNGNIKMKNCYCGSSECTGRMY